MPIGVYRIFLSETWRGDRLCQSLIHGLDALPDFLYRIDRIMPAGEAGAAADFRSALRIAMTHSHVAVVLAGRISECSGEVSLELQVARTGFRRPIPLIAVLAPGETANPVLMARHPAIGRWVEWSATAVACAIQDLAEEAARDRRGVAPAAGVLAVAPRAM